jgi:flagellar protein FlhE
VATALAILAATGGAGASELATTHAWTASVNGPAIHGRGQRALSPPILPVGHLQQAQGVITAVRWRYRFDRVPPRDLQAYLCNAQRCVLLPEAEGRTEAFLGDDATQGFVFAFNLPGKGGVMPVLVGGTNQITVGFR